MLPAGIATALYCQNDERVYYMLSRVVVHDNVSIGCMNKASNIQTVLPTQPRKYPTAQGMSRPSAFEMHLHTSITYVVERMYADQAGVAWAHV